MSKYSTILKSISAVSAFVMTFSMTGISAMAADAEGQALNPPIIADGNDEETKYISCDDIVYEGTEGFAAATINGGVLRVNKTDETNGTIKYKNENDDNTSTALIGDGHTTSEETVFDIFVANGITSSTNAVDLSNGCVLSEEGDIVAGNKGTGLKASNAVAELNNCDIQNGKVGVDASAGSIVHVNGNVNALDTGIISENGSLVHVEKTLLQEEEPVLKGNVSGDNVGAHIAQGYAIIEEDLFSENGVSAIIREGGTLVVQNNAVGKVSGIDIDLEHPAMETTVLVEGSLGLYTGENGYALRVRVPATVNNSSDPQITVYRIDATPDHIVQVITDPDSELDTAEYAKEIINSINYIIKTEGEKGAIKSTTADKTTVTIQPKGMEYPFKYTHDTMNINKDVQYVLASGYSLRGNEVVSVKQYPDGIYYVTLTDPLGGIVLMVVKDTPPEEPDDDTPKSSEDNSASESTPSNNNNAPAPASGIITSASSTDSSRTVELKLSEISPAEMKSAVINNISVAPAGGTLKIETDGVSCLDRTMLQAFADKGNIDLELVFTYMGKKMRVIIPKGTDIKTLLDANGYCGFLKLADLLGFQFI